MILVFGGFIALVIIAFLVYSLTGHLINGRSFWDISTGRSEMWSIVFHASLERPILGWGWGNGEPMGKWVGVGFVENCHNVLLNILLWTGFPGLILFCIIIVMWVIKIYKELPLIENTGNTWFLVVTVALFAQSLLDPLLVGEDTRLGSPFFWFLAGMLYYLDQTYTDKRAIS